MIKCCYIMWLRLHKRHRTFKINVIKPLQKSWSAKNLIAVLSSKTNSGEKYNDPLLDH